MIPASRCAGLPPAETLPATGPAVGEPREGGALEPRRRWRWALVPAVAALALLVSALLPGCGSEDPAPADATTTDVAADVAADAPALEDAPADAAADTAGTDDAPVDEELYLPFDLGPDFEAVVHDPDVSVTTPDTFSGCPALGVSPYWEGRFEGVVSYDLEEPIPGARQSGLFLVEGTLNFEIRCLDQKLIVGGALEGDAEAADQVGKHPFVAPILGEFDPSDRSIDAEIVDAIVTLFRVIDVVFEGTFTGRVNIDGDFIGNWDGVHISNSLHIDGEGQGHGTWVANAVHRPSGGDGDDEQP